MKICENCGIEHKGEYGSGRFCDSKCARSFSTKVKRKEINKKVSETLLKKNLKPIRFCEVCGTELNRSKRKKIKTCGNSCGSKLKWLDSDYKEYMSKLTKKRCETLEERKRLRDIGRKGGFGNKGYTKGGTHHHSNLEKKCFEFLEENKIKFLPHKNIPNSSKVSDVYLIDKDLWVEIDGIDRDKRRKWIGKDYDYWLEKLEIYKKNNLNFKVVKNFKEFRDVTQ